MKSVFRSICLFLLPVSCQPLQNFPDNERSLGCAAMAEYRERYEVCNHAGYQQMLDRCVRRLKSAAGNTVERAEFVLLECNLPHAECLPGKKIIIFSGFLDIIKSDSELAFVLAHELGHALARHPDKAIELSQQPGGRKQLVKQRLHFELEADSLALNLMAQACYNPREGVQFWRRYSSTPQARLQQELAGTHPPDETRIRAMEQALSQAMQEYKQACKKNRSFK